MRLMRNMLAITKYPSNSTTDAVLSLISKESSNLTTDIVRQLADIETFKDFTVQALSITWSNGVDFAPEFIKSLMNS